MKVEAEPWKHVLGRRRTGNGGQAARGRTAHMATVKAHAKQDTREQQLRSLGMEKMRDWTSLAEEPHVKAPPAWL